MENDHGVYRIPCTINGAKVKLIFDTGASVVSISMPMAKYLYDNDYITDRDILGIGQSTTADGSIVDHIKFIIKKLVIGDVELDNVEAVVIASQDAPLLLGQSALRKLGKFEIEGDNLIISNGGNLTETEIETIGELAEKAMNDSDYSAAVKYYGKLYEINVLTDYGLFEYARACDFNKEYKKALNLYFEVSQTIFGTPSGYNAVTAQFNVFFDIACCYVNLGEWGTGIIYIDKALELAEKTNCEGTKLNPNDICETICNNFAATLWENEFYGKAADFYFKYMEYWGKNNGMTANQVWKNSVSKFPPPSIKKDETLLDVASDYTECQYYSYRWNDEETETAMMALARNGSNNARIFCNTMGIKY